MVNNLEERLIFDVPDTHILVVVVFTEVKISQKNKVANKIAIIPTSGDIEKYETNLKLFKNNPHIFCLNLI